LEKFDGVGRVLNLGADLKVISHDFNSVKGIPLIEIRFWHLFTLGLPGNETAVCSGFQNYLSFGLYDPIFPASIYSWFQIFETTFLRVDS